MFASLKLMQLSSAVQNRRNSHEAYSAVIELGRIGSEKAIDLLIKALDRGDGVARSAARELGRLSDPRTIKPLVALLKSLEAGQSAAEALVRFGAKAVDPLLAALKEPDAGARRLAATALGTIGDKRAVEPLSYVMQSDDEYSVRTAAAKALGELKDPRALWVIVGTLKLRDESTPERQAALEELRQAASIAWRKIGDPLAKGNGEVHLNLDEPGDSAAAPAEDVETHPKLTGDLSYLSEQELIGVLKEIVAASEEVSWAKLENRQPMLSSWFNGYDRRRQAAETVGTELHRRGGKAVLRQILERDLGSYAAIQNWWSAAGLM